MFKKGSQLGFIGGKILRTGYGYVGILAEHFGNIWK